MLNNCGLDSCYSFRSGGQSETWDGWCAHSPQVDSLLRRGGEGQQTTNQTACSECLALMRDVRKTQLTKDPELLCPVCQLPHANDRYSWDGQIGMCQKYETYRMKSCSIVVFYSWRIEILAFISRQVMYVIKLILCFSVVVADTSRRPMPWSPGSVPLPSYNHKPRFQAFFRLKVAVGECKSTPMRAWSSIGWPLWSFELLYVKHVQTSLFTLLLVMQVLRGGGCWASVFLRCLRCRCRYRVLEIPLTLSSLIMWMCSCTCVYVRVHAHTYVVCTQVCYLRRSCDGNYVNRVEG